MEMFPDQQLIAPKSNEKNGDLVTALSRLLGTDFSNSHQTPVALDAAKVRLSRKSLQRELVRSRSKAPLRSPGSLFIS